MSRQLTALERRRITGETHPRKQLYAFHRLGLPARPRYDANLFLIECVAYEHLVRPLLTDAGWKVIEDEIIGSFGPPSRITGHEQTNQRHHNRPLPSEPAREELLGAQDEGREETYRRRDAEPERVDTSPVAGAAR